MMYDGRKNDVLVVIMVVVVMMIMIMLLLNDDIKNNLICGTLSGYSI